MTTAVGQDKRFFEAKKEDRDWYFVEYRPPIAGFPFATLQIVVPGNARPHEAVAEVAEHELDVWLKRYSVPIMVSAFDATGDVIKLAQVRGCDRLIGFVDDHTGKVVREWRLLANQELPDDALDPSYLKSVYRDIPHKTGEEVRAGAEQHRRQVRLGWWIVFGWAVVVPAAVAVLEWWSDWLGAVVLIYALWKALRKALELTGKWPRSKRELEKEADERRMRHHHYHCEQNPEAFERLKVENVERWARDDIEKEALSLKRDARTHSDADS
jgi:hypothetical protein